ncbi:hypothetical protein OHC33_001472 [Knufia fluminis]|uniref:Uncharacterized protein n=1 Tax=Knufia fluminis TaxID=191047 RepID=A0AAN8F5L1_9EURO|nr:hypothetical protein OHC33_001472 [Knufia fluminis]
MPDLSIESVSRYVQIEARRARESYAPRELIVMEPTFLDEHLLDFSKNARYAWIRGRIETLIIGNVECQPSASYATLRVPAWYALRENCSKLNYVHITPVRQKIVLDGVVLSKLASEAVIKTFLKTLMTYGLSSGLDGDGRSLINDMGCRGLRAAAGIHGQEMAVLVRYNIAILDGEDGHVFDMTTYFYSESAGFMSMKRTGNCSRLRGSWIAGTEEASVEEVTPG